VSTTETIVAESATPTDSAKALRDVGLDVSANLVESDDTIHMVLLHLLANPVPVQTPNATDWRAVRDAYYSHHARCPVCIAAGKGYGLRCGAGASLWAAYSATPWPGYSRR
jgi:hypothetical protein